jgi:hypothetical protein
MVQRKFCSHKFYVRKEYSLHPSELFWMVQLQIIVACVFFWSFFFLILNYHTTLTTCNLPYNIIPCKQSDNGTAPPLSKIMPKHDEDLSGIGKKTSMNSWGQCVSFQSNCQKKHKNSLKKHTFSPLACQSVA